MINIGKLPIYLNFSEHTLRVNESAFREGQLL